VTELSVGHGGCVFAPPESAVRRGKASVRRFDVVSSQAAALPLPHERTTAIHPPHPGRPPEMLGLPTLRRRMSEADNRHNGVSMAQADNFRRPRRLFRMQKMYAGVPAQSVLRHAGIRETVENGGEKFSGVPFASTEKKFIFAPGSFKYTRKWLTKSKRASVPPAEPVRTSVL
jgi:hypothetical protein